MEFSLHPRLASGTHDFGRISGCRILLKDNALFPWLIVVPEVDDGVEDLHQLDAQSFREVMDLVCLVSKFVAGHFHVEKLNVACIGNQVRQMHVHIVGRSSDDRAWPGVVWGFEAKEGYRDDRVIEIRRAFEESIPSRQAGD